MSEFTVPGLSSADGSSVADILQERLSAYNDLHLTLKHVHWNVVGPNFIGVHEMIDPQVELVRGYADDVAERIRHWVTRPRALREQSSAIERGTTTPSAETTLVRTSLRSTSSTPESSPTVAPQSTASARSIRSPRTC